MNSIETIDAEHLGRLPSAVDPAICYLASLIKHGPSSYLGNAKVRMEAVLVDRKVLPLVISDGIEGNSNICSAYGHYHDYAMHEFARRFGAVPSGLLRAPRSLLGGLLRAGSIDRIVFVNNWLLSTNPRHGLSDAQVAALTTHLIHRYPEAAIVFRSINCRVDSRGFDALRANSYRFVPSRTVFMVDTASGDHCKRSNFHLDSAKLKKTSYSIIKPAAEHAARCAQLYNDLYIRKHSPLNPEFKSPFFALIFKAGFMSHRGFVKNGRVDAFFSYLVEDRLITACLLAYDLSLPRELALYRKMFALMIQEAAERKALVNLSAGVAEFKMLRGAVPVQEYDAVYDRHLPPRRRLPWLCLQALGQLGRMLTPRPLFPAKTLET